MLLGFQRRFEAKILAHEKRHTIRAKRKGKRQWRVGDICDCYGDTRQPTMHLLGRWPCVRVQDIRIEGRFHAYGGFIGGVLIEGQQLSQDECEALAIGDGFSSWEEMTQFWKGRLPFRGDMIHWDPEAVLVSDAPQGARRSPRAGKRKAGLDKSGQNAKRTG